MADKIPICCILLFCYPAPMKRQKALTLFELLIVLAIVAGLASMAIPSYQQYLVRTRRMAASLALFDLAEQIHQYFSDHPQADTVQLSDLPDLPTLQSTWYQFVITSASHSHFALQAIPQGEQAKLDQRCGRLIYTSLGERSVTGTAGAACWRLNR